MPNQPSATANRFFGKRISSADVAEGGCSATLRVSQAENVIHGDTIYSGGRLSKIPVWAVSEMSDMVHLEESKREAEASL